MKSSLLQFFGGTPSANMPRARWSPRSVLCLLLFHGFWIVPVFADCWFDNQKFPEGTEVATAEPCLNCTCKHGALVCYLRVCTELPDPPPQGCIILHRHRSCCPELVCADVSMNNGIEARSEPDDFELDIGNPSLGSACLENGTIYGPGSAMGSSSLCEYCYCIGGKQTCIKPRCLLHLEGCMPSFEPHSCCPVRYNCTGHHKTITSTTQRPEVAKGGCMVAGKHHSEGSRVLEVGHSICDNCYCLRGVLRCEPLSCAPAILGCTPVVKPGECCAASYNCNGTIEIQPEPNYGHYPTVSKEYAKLRKEVQQRRPLPVKNDKKSVPNPNSTYYVIAESSHGPTTKTQRVPGHFGTTRHIMDPSTKGPFYYNTMDYKNGKTDALIDIRVRPSTIYKKNASSGTTNYAFQNATYKRPFMTTVTPKNVEITKPTTPKQVRYADYDDAIGDNVLLSLVDSLFDNEIKKEDKNVSKTNDTLLNNSTVHENITEPITTKTEQEEFNFTDVLSTLWSTLTEEDFSTTLDDANTTTVLPGITNDLTTLSDNETTTETLETKTPQYSTAVTALVTTTDCITKNSHTTPRVHEKQASISLTPTELSQINELEGKLDLPTSTELDGTSTVWTTERDMTVVDLESKVKVDTITAHPYKKNPSEIEAILNSTISKNKDYEEYDYNEPTLPPSLPNLRIIPFVAADALDLKKQEQDNAVYPSPHDRIDRITESPPYSLFSPPTKTEGGFVPKEPPILHEYYESGYHTTGIDITSVTALPVPAITNPSKTHENNCIADGREIRHTETVRAEGCIICVCFFGNVVCQQPPCPPPAPGCRKATRMTPACCPQFICDPQEAPTVVLDRIDVTPSPQEVLTVADGMATPDPFRDVIRTEPAPDLQSLIGDIMPFLQRQSSTQQMTTEATTPRVESTTAQNATDEELSFNKVLELLFGETTTDKPKRTEVSLNQTSTTEKSNSEVAQSTTVKPPDKTQSHPNSVDSAAGVGLLKLAGCNIYGRMYRVGRIISELSSPCLECKCTEIGVQCTPLKC